MLSGLRKPFRYAVFISGTGSTLQCLLEMQHQLEIGLVISNKTNAFGLLKAKRFGKKCILLQNPIDYDLLQKTLLEYRIDRLILAGFMKILPSDFVDLWKEKIINIHPSLLPLYPGLDAAERSWNDQSPMGVSIHHVNAQMDEGKIFLQQTALDQLSISNMNFKDSELFLRRTEQHLLRELVLRWQ